MKERVAVEEEFVEESRQALRSGRDFCDTKREEILGTYGPGESNEPWVVCQDSAV